MPPENNDFLQWDDNVDMDHGSDLDIFHLVTCEPPRMPRKADVEADLLFVHPCGTPMDICFSPEVAAHRREYWASIIYRMGGRVVSQDDATACYLIVVPDGRLWLPSKMTIMYIQQERYTNSVVFEEWLEATLQRRYILPPVLLRIYLVAEYLRIANSPMAYLNHIRSTALIPGENGIPSLSTTADLLTCGFSLDPAVLFHGQAASRRYLVNSERVNLPTSVVIATVFAMGTLWRQFSSIEWLNLLRSEVKLLSAATNMDAQLLGYWPSHPAQEYNIRGAGRLKCPGMTIEEKREHWIVERLSYCDADEAAGHYCRDIDRAIDPLGLNTITDATGTVILGSLPMVLLSATTSNEPSNSLGPRRGTESPPTEAEELTDPPLPPDAEVLEAALHEAEVEELEAQNASIERASEEIEDEVQSLLDSDEESTTDQIVESVQFDLPDYVSHYETELGNAKDSPARKESVAACILTGWMDERESKRAHVHVGDAHKMDVAEAVFSIDVDSIMASFQALDPFPFKNEETFQMCPVGPFHRRQIGTSKFRIDSAEQGSNVNWQSRSPVHHFGNTLFLTIGSKTSIWAIFPRLLDTQPGRKTAAINMRYCRAFYDKVVRVAGVQVFGEAAIRHWPLSCAHYLWNDRDDSGKMRWAQYSLASTVGNQARHPVQALMQEMLRITGTSDDPDVKILDKMRFYIQRQNEKLEFREDDIFGRKLPVDERPQQGQYPQITIDAVKKVLHRSLEDRWANVPLDTHVDLAVEISSIDVDKLPYLLQTSHPHLLMHYIGINQGQADSVTRSNRRSEHPRYKLHKTAGLKDLASLSYRTLGSNTNNVRELKAYNTFKGYTYSSGSRYRHHEIVPSRLLSSGSQCSSYFTNLIQTLNEEEKGGSNAVRIEVTIPYNDASIFGILPTRAIFTNVITLPRVTIPRYQSLKVQAISIIHTAMVSKDRDLVARQNLRVLTLLALMGWFTKVLFSRVNPMDSRDAPYFDALNGYRILHKDPYEHGQLLFTMSNMWITDGAHCPSVADAVGFDMRMILKHFNIPNQLILSNLIAGRDRGFKQVGSLRNTTGPPSLGWLLGEVSMQSAPLNSALYDLGFVPPFPNCATLLNNRTADEVTEALFVCMARAIWNKIPCFRKDGKDSSSLSSLVDADKVATFWGVDELRPPYTVHSIGRYFVSCSMVSKNIQERWIAVFCQVFGTFPQGGIWTCLPKASCLRKLGYYIHWENFMLSLSSNDRFIVYRLMKGKFDTLTAFPALLASRGWKVEGTGDTKILSIIPNPNLQILSETSGYRIGN